MYTILVCDDERDIVSALEIYLTAEGYRVLKAYNGKEALSVAAREDVHLILMDIMMPVMDGLTAMAQLRQTSNVPVILLTAKSEDTDKVLGLNVGADDYITKPVKPKVLMSKIRALLRRVVPVAEESQARYSAGDLVIDREGYRVIHQGREMVLPRKEFELLALLASRPGRVFKREEIMDQVWGNEVVVGGRTIDVHIRKLREKIGDDRFKTIKGVGYKFEEK